MEWRDGRAARRHAARRTGADRVRVAAAAVVLCGAVVVGCSDGDGDGGVDVGALGQTEVDDVVTTAGGDQSASVQLTDGTVDVELVGLQGVSAEAAGSEVPWVRAIVRVGGTGSPVSLGEEVEDGVEIAFVCESSRFPVDTDYPDDTPPAIEDEGEVMPDQTGSPEEARTAWTPLTLDCDESRPLSLVAWAENITALDPDQDITADDPGGGYVVLFSAEELDRQLRAS